MHLSTGHLSAWPNFSGSEESTSEGLLLCVFVCVYVRTRVLLWVFPPCLSNRKLMWSSTEDREKAFSFHCESFEREREKKRKRVERKKRDQAAALIQPSAIWPASLSVPLSFHSLYLSVYLSFFLCVCGLFLIPDEQQCSGGTRGFMESSQVLWEDWVRGLLCG